MPRYADNSEVLLFRPAFLVFLLSSTIWAQSVVKFSSDPTDVPNGAFAVGPFPSNALTVPDASQGTGVRVNLPSSESSCTSEASPVCSNTSLLNQLSGFSINPRLMVCFSALNAASAPIDVTTLRSGIGLVSVRGGSTMGIDQVIFDPVSNCAFAKPSNVLSQASSYVLLVGTAVHDLKGNPVGASSSYTPCSKGEGSAYCTGLAAALAGKTAPGGGSIVGASLFTTMEATAWLESARRFADGLPSAVIPAGFPSTFQVSQLKQFTWVPQNGGIPPQDIPLSALSNVAEVSFGLFLSPNYLNPSTVAITTGAASPISYNAVSYHVFTPAVKAGAKIPVVIFGHGLSDNQFGAPTYIASTLAKNGFATLAIEIPGHGYGPASFVTLTSTNGSMSTEFTPGRGVATSPGATIGSTDGCIASGAIGVRDCGRQTAVDLEALVHAIVSTGGLGVNLDPSRIYYVGQSFGSTVGTLFSAVDPTVRAAVLNGDGGTSTDIARLTITGRPLGLGFLETLGDPALFNVISLGAPAEDYFHDQFNDNYVFKGEPPVTNSIPGAMAIQAAFEAPDWLGMLGDPLAFAPHLKLSPLAGVPAKKTLFQFGFGDLEVSNPTESAVVLAAGGQATTSFLEFQIAASLQPELLGVEDPNYPGLPILPHRVLSNPTIFTPGNEAELSLALAEQQQSAAFFAANGNSVTDPNIYLTSPFTPSEGVFQTPINSLPEALNFLQIPK